MNTGRIICMPTSSATRPIIQIAKQYRGDILSLQPRRGYNRVLLNTDISDTMDMPRRVLLASELADSGCRNVKLAIRDCNYDAERCEFEEMVNTNRGLQVKVCASMRDAEDWLD